jgi:drug/metabolite transporter (DMT)-like permease
MLYLLLSILFNAYLGIIFAYFNRYKIDIFQAIVFNYITCVITGSLVLGEFPIQTETLHLPWFIWATLMGFLFITVFNLIAYSSQKVGITITQTANRLSLVIPVLLSVILYSESISWLKMSGIAVALIAVVLSSQRNSSADESKRKMHWELFLPVLLFLSSGIIDSMTKYVEINFLKDAATSNAYLISGFGIAALFGIVALTAQYVTGKRSFHRKYLLSGIILGVPNYFSIYFLIKALKNPNLNSSATIPINNISVLFLVGLFGIFVFKEKLSKANYIGLGLTILAILLIYLGDKM